MNGAKVWGKAMVLSLKFVYLFDAYIQFPPIGSFSKVLVFIRNTQFSHELCAGLKRHSETSPLGRESLGRFIWSTCELFFIGEYSSIQRTYNANREKKAMKK
jgi:hypothetical protein